MPYNKKYSKYFKLVITIEGLEESLNTLLYDDPPFKRLRNIYLVVPGAANNNTLLMTIT